MTFDSFEIVFFTVGFVVPGFVWATVLAMLVPTRTAPIQVRLLEFLTLSCFNYGLWSWLLFAMFSSDFAAHHPLWSGLFLCGIIFLSPIALGVASGWLQQKELVSRFLNSIGLRTVHHVPQAWDRHFSQQKPYWGCR